jgi:hypothetical protein
MVLPTHNAIQFHSKSEHLSHLYDACLLIVNTYNQTDMLDFYECDGVSPYTFMKFSRNILNQISNIQQGN